MMVKKTNEKLLQTEYREYLKDIICDRLYRLSLLPFEVTIDLGETLKHLTAAMGKGLCAETMLRFMELNCCDPVRTFVKNEPHSITKLEQGRVRLISSVSLADQVIERLLSSPINNNEIYQWEGLPSMPGIGLTTDEDFKRINRLIQAIPEKTQTDIKGWDWSVQYYELIDRKSVV